MLRAANSGSTYIVRYIQTDHVMKAYPSLLVLEKFYVTIYILTEVALYPFHSMCHCLVPLLQTMNPAKNNNKGRYTLSHQYIIMHTNPIFYSTIMI